MALDDTVGGENSNSYASVGEADAYFADRSHSSIWEDLDPSGGSSDRSSALVTATSILDWYMSWVGYKATSLQALDWPRKDVFDESGDLLPSDTIPKDIKVALFELALSSIEEDRTADWDLAGLNRVKLSSLEIETDNQNINPKTSTIPSKIYKILGMLITNEGGTGIRAIRLVRA